MDAFELSPPWVEEILGDQIDTWKELTPLPRVPVHCHPIYTQGEPAIIQSYLIHLEGSLFKAELCQLVHLMTRIVIGF